MKMLKVAFVVAMSVVGLGITWAAVPKAPREPAKVIPKAAKVHAKFERNPLRLKSGAIGRLHGWGKLEFSRTDGDGKPWSAAVQVSEPHVMAYLYSEGTPIVTNSGRIIVPVYTRIGRRDFVPEKVHFANVALRGDEWSYSGSHSYEPHPCASRVGKRATYRRYLPAYLPC